jgi:hypothetical protein
MAYNAAGFRDTLCVSVAIVFLAIPTSAQAEFLIAQDVAKSRGEEFPMGSWSVSMNDRQGRLYHGTLVLVRKNGPTNDGFIRWTDGRVGFEIVTGRYTPERRALELNGIDWKGRGIGPPLGCYEGVFSEDGRELVNGKAMLVRGKTTIGPLAFNARWKDGSVAVPDELVTALKPIVGLPLLYRNLSATYVLGDMTVRQMHDLATLEELSKTGEADARKLATLRLNLDRKREEFDRDVGKTLDPDQIQNDMFRDLVSRRLITDNKGTVQKMQQRIIANAKTAVNALKTEKQIRVILNRFLVSRPATPSIDEKGFALSYRVQNKLDVMIEIENRTSRTLHDCVVITEAKVDVAKINEFERRKKNADDPAYALMKLFEIDKSVQDSTALLEKARWDYERCDKGSVIYVREWKPDVRVKTALSPIRAAMYAESTQLTVWSPDGHLQVALSHEMIADAVNKAFAPQAKSGRPNRTKRPR